MRGRRALTVWGLALLASSTSSQRGLDPGPAVGFSAESASAGAGSTTPNTPTTGAATNPGTATASDSDDLFSLETLLYRQEDGGGNPFVDEDASIYESLILFQKSVSERDAVALRGIVDVISAASYDAVGELATGATGNNPGRLGGRLTWDHSEDTWGFRLRKDYDQELYYRSNSEGATFYKTLEEEGATLSARIHRYRDYLRNVQFDGSILSDEERNTFTTELGWEQILSPKTRMHLSYLHTDQDGFLATSFNAVRVAGVAQPEVLPRSRVRRTGVLRTKTAVGERDAIELAYRFYDDDWGIAASTLESRYYWVPDGADLIVAPVYRFYDQSASDFFGQTFDVAEPFMTSDPDLGDFTGHLLGVDLTFLDVGFLGTRSDFDLRLNYYDRSDGLDLYWLTFGFTFAF